MSIVHPISRAWISTGGTGAQNYDEFADDAEITAAIAANPGSALAVEMPHRAPGSLGRTFGDSLPQAVERLARAKADGRYTAAEDVVVLYRITDGSQHGTGAPVHGMFAMVETGQISTRADEPGLVIRNEDVFVDKVRERVALAEATGHLLSPVLLLQTGRGPELAEELAAACEAAGPPAVRDTDHTGRLHEVWTVPPGTTSQRLRALAGGGELVVADGNHRSLAAQTGGLDRFLAVVSSPSALTIEPYHRLVTTLRFPPGELVQRLRAAGATVTELASPAQTPPGTGTVHLYADGVCHAVTFPVPPDAPAVERLDHALVERVLFGGVLDVAPGDASVRYIGGDYPASWLRQEVDAGRAALAVLIAPVPVEEFVAVNLARQRMPRKSTWFTPKARAGLVLAELDGQGPGQA